METPSNTANKHKAVETASNFQALQVVTKGPQLWLKGEALPRWIQYPHILELSIPWLISHDVALPRIPPRKKYLQPC
ncbi:UNVERIFIED_CONTAM: hypothetical protein Sradi_2508000 [Sesamum radiatum]|uniref:Uncharacterized protein n=1 Tax=Sesamum radiatum TaxID=300843 RepID=A0AAW2SK77_SESRA